MIESIVVQVRRLAMTDYELVALKAITALDPYVPRMNPASQSLLVVARESVQNALFAYLLGKHNQQEATSRFSNLIMLAATVAKVGHQVEKLFC